jgi:hypothetical protein
LRWAIAGRHLAPFSRQDHLVGEREQMVLCWQVSLNNFYTISIMGKLRNFTSDFSILSRACGKIL